MRTVKPAIVRALVVSLMGIAAVAACSDDESPSSGGNKRDAGSGGSGAADASGGTSGTDAATGGSGGSGGSGGADAQSETGGAGGADGSERTVRGLVVSTGLNPLPNITVVIDGTSVVTNATGGFEVRDVPDTYNLIAADADGREITVYRGLTRRNPLIKRLAGGAHLATVSGTLSGGAGFPNPASRWTVVAFGSDQPIRSYANTMLGPADGPAYGPFNANWGGNASKQGFVCALQYTVDAARLPTQYHGWGCSDVAMSSGGAVNVNVALNAALQTTALSGTVQLPSGYAVTRDEISVYRSDTQLHMFLFFNAIGGSTFSVPVPTGPLDLRIGIEVEAQASGGRSVTRIVGPAVTGLTVPIDEGPSLAAPLANATGVGPSTNFAWSAAGAGAYRIRFESLSPVGRNIAIYTKETSITLPDLTALGLPLPSGQQFFWSVKGGPAATVDEAASSIGSASALQSRESESGQRSFTTAP